MNIYEVQPIFSHPTHPFELTIDAPGSKSITNRALMLAALADGETLPEKYCDHPLSGDYSGCRECHILPDWLLIYRIEKELLILALTRTGTHSDLF